MKEISEVVLLARESESMSLYVAHKKKIKSLLQVWEMGGTYGWAHIHFTPVIFWQSCKDARFTPQLGNRSSLLHYIPLCPQLFDFPLHQSELSGQVAFETKPRIKTLWPLSFPRPPTTMLLKIAKQNVAKSQQVKPQLILPLCYLTPVLGSQSINTMFPNMPKHKHLVALLKQGIPYHSWGTNNPSLPILSYCTVFGAQMVHLENTVMVVPELATAHQKVLGLQRKEITSHVT